jgi:HPt (histidine-containing phosphotransfer) domain-containing protein
VLVTKQMTKTNDRSLEATVNFQELLARVDHDYECLRELVEIFQQETPSLLQSLQEAVAAENMKQVEITGHTLKGMLATLAAPHAAAAAALLENLGRNRDRIGMEDALAGLKYALTVIVPELQRLVSEVRP